MLRTSIQSINRIAGLTAVRHTTVTGTAAAQTADVLVLPAGLLDGVAVPWHVRRWFGGPLTSQDQRNGHLTGNLQFAQDDVVSSILP